MFPKNLYDNCWCTTRPCIFLQVSWIQYGHTVTLCSFTSVIHFQKQKLSEIILEVSNYALVDWPQNRKFCFEAGGPVLCWIHGAHEDVLDSCWLVVKCFCFFILSSLFHFCPYHRISYYTVCKTNESIFLKSTTEMYQLINMYILLKNIRSHAHLVTCCIFIRKLLCDFETI